MKPHQLTALSLIFCASALHAEQQLSYPKAKPLVSFAVPDDWKVSEKHGSLFVVSPDGGDVIVEVATMEAAAGEADASLKEAKATVAEDFKKLKLEASEPVNSKGLEVTLLGGTGEDSNGPAHLNMAVLQAPDAPHPILFSLIADQENASKHAAACAAMMESLSAAGAGEKPEGKPAGKSKTQTFQYPAKGDPDFSMDFPAGWKMKDTEEGTYVESPDKLVAMDVIIVDKDEAEKAQEHLKKAVGGRFKEITWNNGKEPEVNEDKDLGLTATFENAVASDGDDTEKYAVNLVTYVRAKGEKALIFLCQNPLKALDTHADAMESVLKSIKAR